MSTTTRSAFLLAAAISIAPTLAETPFGETGFHTGGGVIEGPGPEGDCELVSNWDETAENGYCWQFAGIVPPDYGSFAECYDAAFVCEAQFVFTQVGYYVGQTFDLYLWEDEGGLPGNVLCSLPGLLPGPIAEWTDCSTHRFVVNCDAPDHFVGYWGDWPGFEPAGWFICSDEDGFVGCPVTKIAPDIGYATGWSPIQIIPTFAGCMSLGISEWVDPTPPVATESSTWGQIKALY